MSNRFLEYFERLQRISTSISVSDTRGVYLEPEVAFESLLEKVEALESSAGTLYFIGNGGSAAIASHLATDFLKNGRVRAAAFNDPCALTCLGNDLGYENIFSAQIARRCTQEDLLIAISSSGESENILSAVATARAKGMFSITLSGFSSSNQLRKSGDVNFYICSHEYGPVEIAHLAICHAVLDTRIGLLREETT